MVVIPTLLTDPSSLDIVCMLVPCIKLTLLMSFDICCYLLLCFFLRFQIFLMMINDQVQCQKDKLRTLKVFILIQKPGKTKSIYVLQQRPNTGVGKLRPAGHIRPAH